MRILTFQTLTQLTSWAFTSALDSDYIKNNTDDLNQTLPVDQRVDCDIGSVDEKTRSLIVAYSALSFTILGGISSLYMQDYVSFLVIYMSVFFVNASLITSTLDDSFEEAKNVCLAIQISTPTLGIILGFVYCHFRTSNEDRNQKREERGEV